MMILNLHGLNGKWNNTTYRLLLKAYAEDLISSPQINYAVTSPAKILDNLQSLENISYVVGNSFGGFYAYILSTMLRIPCLLVNPCIPPEKYIPSLVKGYAYTEELVHLTVEYSSHSQPVYMILGMDDTVLSPACTMQTLQVTQTWKIRGGHSLSGNQQFYSAFKKALERMIANENING